MNENGLLARYNLPPYKKIKLFGKKKNIYIYITLIMFPWRETFKIHNFNLLANDKLC